MPWPSSGRDRLTFRNSLESGEERLCWPDVGRTGYKVRREYTAAGRAQRRNHPLPATGKWMVAGEESLIRRLMPDGPVPEKTISFYVIAIDHSDLFPE